MPGNIGHFRRGRLFSEPFVKLSRNSHAVFEKLFRHKLGMSCEGKGVPVKDAVLYRFFDNAVLIIFQSLVNKP